MRHAATYGIAALGVLATAAAAAETTAAPAMLVVLPTDWLERHATLFSMFGGVVAFAVSTWFVVRQMRDTQSWNMRKTSEEMLSAMITGDFPRLMDRLELEFGWDILSHTHYDAVVARVTPAELVQIDVTLRNVLRHLEVICIKMKNRIIDEEICFDYLRSILTTFYANCDTFIEKERSRRGERKIFTDTEWYAKKWIKIIEKEQQQVPYSELRKDFIKAR